MLNALTVPIIIGAITAYYLYEIVKLGSSFNYNFLIPVAVVILGLCTFEVVGVIRRRDESLAETFDPREVARVIARAPELRFGALVLLFIVLFDHVPFLLLSCGFLVLSPLLVSREANSRLVSPAWIGVSIAISVSTYLIFKNVLNAPLY